MRRFAKLYEDEDNGQILVRRHLDEDDAPCVTVEFAAPDPDGEWNITKGYSFTDTERGHRAADICFYGFTRDLARNVAHGVRADLTLAPAADIEDAMKRRK